MTQSLRVKQLLNPWSADDGVPLCWRRISCPGAKKNSCGVVFAGFSQSYAGDLLDARAVEIAGERAHGSVNHQRDPVPGAVGHASTIEARNPQAAARVY